MESISAVMRAPRLTPAIPPGEMRAALSRKLAEQRLQAIDAEVRAHEHAHVAALGADIRVAQEAYTMEMQAQHELEQEQAVGGVHEWYA